jgi:hypothetical protein
MIRFFLLSLLTAIMASPLSAQTSGSQSPLEKLTAARNKLESSLAMRQMMIAMHNYHNDYNHLPAHAIYDSTGKKPLLSWRVMILPYLEQDKLFKKFKLDEPWDSEHNKALLKEMPKIYQVPGVKGEVGKTYYQVFTMPAKVEAGKTDKFRPVFSLAPTKLTLGQLTVQDGTSNTICIAEAGNPVEWTKPADLLWEHDDAPLPKLGIRPGDTFHVAFGDGSIRQIKKKIDDMDKHTRLMKQLIGRKDGLNEDFSAIVD